MATTLGSTGITFPDSTTQTTAITANPATTNVRQAVTSSSTTTINLASGSNIDLTMAANIDTLSFTNVAASGTAMQINIVVKLNSSGTAYTITWPSSVYWNSTSLSGAIAAPTLAAGPNAVTVIALLTTDGGTKWRGWIESSIPGGEGSSLYMWGVNNYGQIGDNTTASKSSPVLIGSASQWSRVSVTYLFSLGIKTDGTMWFWGQCNNYIWGNGASNPPKSSPNQIGTGTTWANVKALAQSTTKHALAVKSDGTLWAWGSNENYRLGVSGISTGNYGSPRQVGSDSNWSTAKSALGGSRGNSMAIKTDGSLWGWGRNTSYGSLGLGNSASPTSPKQVGGLTNWRSVHGGSQGRTMMFTKTDGTLWFSGVDQNGLGIGLGSNYSPTQIGALTTWTSQFDCSFYSAIGITTDGKMWAWGRGGNGHLGLGSSATQYSPVQVGSNTDWTTCGITESLGMATRGNGGVGTGGTLWMFGKNYSGQMGGLPANSSPVQLGSSSAWVVIDSHARTDSAAAFITAVSNPA